MLRRLWARHAQLKRTSFCRRWLATHANQDLTTGYGTFEPTDIRPQNFYMESPEQLPVNEAPPCGALCAMLGFGESDRTLSDDEISQRRIARFSDKKLAADGKVLYILRGAEMALMTQCYVSHVLGLEPAQVMKPATLFEAARSLEFFVTRNRLDPTDPVVERLIETVEQARNSVPDSVLSVTRILALCCSPARWTEARDQLLSQNVPFSNLCVNAVICAALRNQAFEDISKVYGSVIDRDTGNPCLLSEMTISVWLKTFSRSQDAVRNFSSFSSFLNVLKQAKEILADDLVDEFVNVLPCIRVPEKLGGGHLRALPVRIGSGRYCRRCDKSLPALDNSITDSVRTKLASLIYDHLLIGKNVFSSTTPEEVKRFFGLMKRLNNEKIKVGAVVDGNNLFITSRKQNTDAYSVLKMLHEKYGHLLFISRAHVKRSLRVLPVPMNTFFVDNLSQDDVFILYAAVQFNAFMISRDVFAGEGQVMEDLGNEGRSLLRQFVQRKRVALPIFLAEGAIHSIPDPLGHEVATHKMSECEWHVPYQQVSKGLTQKRMPRITSWFCVGPSKEQNSPQRGMSSFLFEKSS